MYGDDLIDAMHKQKETPEYKDHCSHPGGSYVGSILTINHNHDEEWLDIYVYEDSFDGQSVCIRYGADGAHYISAGSILQVIQLGMRRKSDAYEYALHVIRKHGVITFIRNG